MIKIDENDPIGEVDPSFPYRDVTVRRNTDMKEFYDLQKEIGRGKFGTVYRCTEKSTGLKLAAKFIGISKRQDRRNAEREVEIMRELQHPRLIQMYDAFEINNIMCVVLELIEGGELFERVIDDDFILTEKSVSVFMRQICEGIAFIHSKNILHLDMKPENILCLTRTGNRIKIIDFGLARKYDPEKKLQVLFGTPEFVAPEVVNFDSIGFGTDMWSVGVICYVLLSGLSPFMGETDVQTMANVTIAQYDYDDEAFNEISADAKDFIGKLLLKDREQRMSATECLSHRWLRRRKPVCSVPPNPIPLSELDLQKDTLRNLVDRWNNDTNITLIVNNEDGKGDKVVDICKTNGIIEQQSKSGTVRQSNSIAACDTKDQSATMQPIESVKISENTLLPIESVEAPNILNQVLKPLSDNAFSTSAPSLKRSLSPDMKLENCQKEQNISKSISPSRSGSSSPAVNHKPLLNGDVENMKNQSSQELPKSSHLELPQKSPQKESAGVKKSPSTSPKPTKKKPAKTPSPSINDQQLHQDEPHCKNIDTKQERELISRDGQKSLSTSPKPPKKKLTKTPSPLINDQQPIYHNESVLSGDTSTKQKHLEIVEKSPQRENYDKSAISIQPNKNADVIVNGVSQNIDVDISEAVNKSTTPQKTNETSSENHSNHVVTTAKSVKDISQQKEKRNGEVLDVRSNSVSPVPNKKSAQENNLQKNKSNSRIFDTKSTSISPTPNKQLAQEINTQKASSNSKISDIRSTSVSPAPDAQPVQEISKQKVSSNNKISDIRSTSVSPAPNAQPVQEISQNINSSSKLLNIRSTSASPVPSTQSAQEISKQKINSNSKISEIRSTSVSPIPNKQDTTEISKTKNKLSKFLDIRSTSVSPTPSKESPQRIIQQKGKPNEISTTRSSSISPIPNGTPSKEMNQQNNDTKDKLHDIPDTNTTITSQPLRTPIVEISDETYECVKKRRFTIKSVESKTTTIDSGDSMRVKSVEKTSTETSTTQPANRRSIFTPEVSPKVLRKLNDFMSTSELMKRRISDISNLLSRTEQDMDHSISEEMSSLCNKLNRIVRLRHDSYSMDGSSNIKRPKFRISYFSRDVPLASTPPLHADLLNYLPLNDETISTPVWSFQKTNPFHSDPSSLRNSPERFASPSLTKKLLSKFFKDSLDYDISSTPSTSNGLPKDKITGIIS